MSGQAQSNLQMSLRQSYQAQFFLKTDDMTASVLQLLGRFRADFFSCLLFVRGFPKRPCLGCLHMQEEKIAMPMAILVLRALKNID